MTSAEARRLILRLKEKTQMSDSLEIQCEALKFFAWVIRQQEEGNSVFMEQDGVFQEILLLYRRSQQAEEKEEVANVG